MSETNGTTNGHAGDLAAARAEWERDMLQPALERSPERAVAFETSIGPVERLYTPPRTNPGTFNRCLIVRP